MKGSRRLQFDDDFDDDDDYDDYPYDDDDDFIPNAGKVPPRSVTLGDFFAPGLMVKNEPEPEPEPVDAEAESYRDYSDYPPYEEEDFDDDYPSQKEIDELMKKLSDKLDISKCDQKKIVTAYNNLERDYSALFDFVKRGNCGPCKPRPRFQPQQTVQKPKIPPRAQSVRNLKDLTLDQHSMCKNSLESVKKALEKRKKHLNLVIVGHVDAGKSTLIGHILLLRGVVSRSTIAQIEKKSAEIGRPQDSLSWIMAEDEEERRHGVTIDVAMKHFETEKLDITVLDAPGHRDYVPNMIAGASQADAALLVVDVRNPNIERGQAGEHLLLCRSLGVNSLVVAINKMDTVDYDQSFFEDVKRALTNYLKGLNWTNVTFVPTSAVIAKDLETPKERMPWYSGPTVFEAIDNITPPAYDIAAPFLMCVSESVECGSHAITVSGRVECGFVCPQDDVRVLPADQTPRVTKVTVNGNDVPFAPAGTIADVTFSTALAVENVMIGSALLDPQRTLKVAKQFTARVRTFQMSSPLLKGAALVFHRHAVDLPLKIVSLVATLDKKTKLPKQRNISFVPSNALAEIIFSVENPIPIEVEEVSKSYGRFIIRAGGATLGFGSVISVSQKDKSI